ncbi:GDP-mannose 4,6-dehydratase [Cohnella fermenti]|uniref:NAD-dependent epimerase/dehydratase family protein n=1 Tax=Cohnella fermenti TaxID=2565925 RepID=A0A4S4BL75_9BACL|nr:GDP-mannose 4,6-dehydratase [Cohnella fermenti]THF74916.1 NAD-dependent epimerase/dehydratase family protein [Cohnella fermenti]
MRVLVTGAGGFVGRHLVDHLAMRGHDVVAGTRGSEARVRPGIRSVSLDMLSAEDIRKAVSLSKPEAIIHLAAQSNVADSWRDPLHTMRLNTIASIQLLDTIRELCPGTKLISIGSSEEYGATPQCGEPITETAPCLPQNPYAVSKFSAGQLLLQMARRDGLNVVHVRPFNHFGPGQSLGFVIADFASQIARIEQEETAPIIRVGNLAAKRDFTDVRDVVRAYASLIECEAEPGIFNASSMSPREVGGILHTLIGFSQAPISIEVDNGKFRPIDVPVYVGSSDKLRQAVGWSPQLNFEQSLLETLDWWRERTGYS